MATQQYFALDSNATGYADAIAKLATDTSTNRGYTVTQVVRSASHDSDIKIVCAYVDEADLTGDTANLHSDNFPNALCVDRYIDLQDRRERLFPILGEMARTPYSEMAGVRYFCPDGVNTSGTEDGQTPWTAFNGPRSAQINGGASRVHQGGMKYIGCRGVVHKSAATFSTTAGGDIDFADASATERVEFGCDHPLSPAIILPTFTHTAVGLKGEAWVHEGGNIYSQSDWGNAASSTVPFQNALLVTSAVDPTKSVSWLLENCFYIKAADETSLVSGEWFTSDGIKMYVRMLDDQAPPAGFNISHRWDGLGGYWLDISAAKNIQLNRINLIAGTDGVGTTGIRNCTDVTVAGGRIALADEAGYFRGANATHWKFKAATYGRRTYDVDDDIMFDSDVVDENHRLVQELITDKGSSAATFADMKEDWVMLMGQGNGPGLNNNTATNLDNIDGLYVVDCNSVMTNTRGTVVSYDHDDGHGLSGRNGGLEDRTWQRFVLLRGGRHYDYYVSATGEANAPYSGSGTNCANNISQDFLILGTNGRASGVGKASTGIGWEHDNDSVVYLDGTGIKTGCIFRRFAIAGITPSDMTGAAIGMVNEQEMQFLDYIVEDCNYHYQMGRNFTESMPYVALVQSGVVTEVTEDLLLGTGGGVATTLTLAAGDSIVFGSIGPFRRVELLIPSTGAAGTYTLAFEELRTGDTWTAVDNLSDGSSNLQDTHATIRSSIQWDRNDGQIETDFDTATGLYFFRIRVASGSFTTAPIITRVAGRFIGSAFYSRRATVRDLAEGWNATASSTYKENSGYIDIDDFTLRLLSGQTVAASTIFNDKLTTFASWQTNASPTSHYYVKKTLNTDAPKDSNHGSNVTADDIEEVA